MIPVDSIFRLLASSLSIWESKERSKYIDRYMKLKKDYYEESNKENPDHAVLDNIIFDIKLLVDSVGSQLAQSDVKNSLERKA